MALFEMSEKERLSCPDLQEELDCLSNYQVIGDVAVVCIPPSAGHRSRELADEPISWHKGIRAVLKKT